MRTMSAISLALSLLASTADAKPRHHRKPAAQSKWMRDCIHERTGPDGGVSVTEARKICKAEQPDDEVELAKSELAVAKHHAKIAKLAQRAAKAIEACEEEVSIACEDTTERDHDGGECSDATLRAKHAFDVCTGHGPAFVAEGK